MSILYICMFNIQQFASFLLTIGSLRQEGRRELDRVCVCINGYMQPCPFIRCLYPALSEVEDGFVDRVSFCSPRSRLLMEEEVDVWCNTLKHPYQTITHWHEHGGQEYTYNDEAKQDYRLFAMMIP